MSNQLQYISLQTLGSRSTSLVRQSSKSVFKVVMAAYKAVAWVYALTPIIFGNLYYTIAVKICGGFAKIDREGRAQGVL
jgi:hypothetical protein